MAGKGGKERRGRRSRERSLSEGSCAFSTLVVGESGEMIGDPFLAILGSEWRIAGGEIVMKTNGTLQQDVKDRISSSFLRKALPDSRRITVETRGGWVILRGNVRSWAESAEAQWAAFAAQGVFDVENDIIIGP